MLRAMLFSQDEGGAGTVPVMTLLWTVFESITEVFLLCMAGYILARLDIIDKQTQRKINVVQVTLLTPCLMTSKIAFSLTREKLREMWIIPIGFIIISSVSAGVAYALSKMFRLSKSQRAFAMAASMFQNSNSLPIALIGSLVVEVPGLKWDRDDTKDQMLGRALTYLVIYSTLGMMLRWSYGVKLLSQADDELINLPTNPTENNFLTHEEEGLDVLSPTAIPGHAAMETDPFFSSHEEMRIEEDEEEERRKRRDSAVSGSSATSAGPSFHWTTDGGSAHSLHPRVNGTNVPGMLSTPLPHESVSSRKASPGVSTIRRSSTHSTHSTVRPRHQPTRTESGREFWGLPEASETPKELSIQDEEGEGEEEDEEADLDECSDEEWGESGLPANIQRRRRQLHTPPHTRLGAFLRKLKHRTKHVLHTVNQFMTVPMYASIGSVFIALFPQLQSALAKTKPLTEAIKSAGQCSIPMTLVVLGAFFYSPPPPTPPQEETTAASYSTTQTKTSFFERKFKAFANSESSNAHPGENRAVFVAVFSRMILVPALLLPFLAWIAVGDWFEAAEDPVFILAATLLISSPPALTLAQITQAASGDAFERLISKTITWSYAVLTPPLTLLYVVLGLLFGRL